MEAFVAPSPAERPRVAVVVPLHGHSAVERNRLQRRLREILRRDWLPGALVGDPEGPLDVVVRARPGAYGATYDEVRAGVLRVLEREGEVGR